MIFLFLSLKKFLYILIIYFLKSKLSKCKIKNINFHFSFIFHLLFKTKSPIIQFIAQNLTHLLIFHMFILQNNKNDFKHLDYPSSSREIN